MFEDVKVVARVHPRICFWKNRRSRAVGECIVRRWRIHWIKIQEKKDPGKNAIIRTNVVGTNDNGEIGSIVDSAIGIAIYSITPQRPAQSQEEEQLC